MQLNNLKKQSYQVDNGRGSNLHAFVAGACAGAVAKTTVAPLDRVKILFQVSNRKFTFSGFGRKMVEILKKEGIGGLFKGNTATLIRIVPFAGIQFLSHKQYKSILTDNEGNLSSIRRLCAGSLSGISATVSTYPLDLMRARMAANRNSSLWKGLVRVSRQGVPSLYRGITPTLVGIIPYAGLSFYTYETLAMCISSMIQDNYIPRLNGGGGGSGSSKGDIGVPYRLLCGGIAGMFGQTVSYPLDTLRRRMQTDSIVVKDRRYTSILNTGRIVLTEEGIRGLYKGLSLNWLKGPVASSISFTVFHTVSNWLAL